MIPGSLSSLFTFLVLAQSDAPRVEGTIVDTSGKPVSAVKLRLEVGTPALNVATSDETGIFSVPRPRGTPGRGPGRAWSLWAIKPGYRVSRASYEGALPDNPLRVVLRPATPAVFGVEGPDRLPISGATISIIRLDREPSSVPNDLSDELAVKTDAGGRAVVEGFVSEEIVEVAVVADGYGVQPRVFLPLTAGPKRIRLRPSVRVVGRLVAENSAATQGWQVFASTTPDDDPGHRGSWTGTAHATTDAEGRFELKELAVGRLSISLTPPAGAIYRPLPVLDRKLPAGEEVKMEIPLSRAVRVEGTVREKGTGQPIAGARLAAFTPSSTGRGEIIRGDDRGRFAFYSLPGNASVSVTELPAAYVRGLGLSLRDLTIPAGSERFELPAIEAERGSLIRGIVLDEQGRPAARATVTGQWGIRDGRGAVSAVVAATTGLDGSFLLEGIPPGTEVMGLAARLGDRASSGTVSVKAGVAEAVTLRLATGVTVALTGRVVDSQGHPMAEALVTITHRTRYATGNGSYGGTVRFEGGAEVRTRADGSFQTPCELSRDVEYRAEVAMPGMTPARSSFLRPGVNGVSGFPDLVLKQVARERSISGRVLDRSGMAVARAEVFSSGDGPGRGRIVTGAQGTFKLEGVARDSVLIFARSDGFRLSGTVVPAESGEARLTLARENETSGAAFPARTSERSRADDKVLSARLVAPLFPRILASGDRTVLPEALASLARCDPDRVIRLIESQAIQVDQGLATQVALGLLDRDPDLALAALRSVGNPEIASRAALDVFDSAPEQRLTWRLDLLALALGRAREIERIEERIWTLAEVADRNLEVGATEIGKAVVREAQELAGGLSRDGFLYPRGDLARPLASIDPTAALALIGPTWKGNENDSSVYCSAFQEVAVRVASTNPTEAERIFGLVVVPGRYHQRLLVPLCGRMARSDRARANRLALASPDPTIRAMALGAMARSLAKADPKAARSLLEEAFLVLETPRKDGMNTAEEMAWLLPVAERIDPSIVPDYLWRCLAGRSRIPRASSADQIRSSAVVATLVGRYDRSAADVVFAPVLDQLPGLIANSEDWYSNIVPNTVASASAFDPVAVASIIERLPMDAWVDSPRIAARVAASRMIGLSPGERIRELLRKSTIAAPEISQD